MVEGTSPVDRPWAPDAGGGIRDVGVPCPPEPVPGGTRDDAAQGAPVPVMVGGALVEDAHGVAVPAAGGAGPGSVDAVAVIFGVEVPLLLWLGGTDAFGSTSHEKIDPNGKC